MNIIEYIFSSNVIIILDSKFEINLLHIACIYNNIHVLEYLIDKQHFDPFKNIETEHNLISYTCMINNLKIFDYLYSRYFKN
jgi:hypothetical protein